MSYEDIKYSVNGEIATLTINRPDHGNMIRRKTAIELAGALRRFRDDPTIRVAILTGMGDKFFSLGGEHDDSSSLDPSTALPIVDVYELVDSVPKPIIAAVNGFAIGGGNVLHLACDLTVAAESAVFRQVGPLVGSFDPGYGTWYLEEAVGRKRAKEMWYLNRKYSAQEALAMGLVNEVVPPELLSQRVNEIAAELKARGPQSLAALKTAFSSRHTGVVGQARLAHDLLLTHYLATKEAKELSQAFSARRNPDEHLFNR